VPWRASANTSQWGVPFQLRLGLNTGIVVVGRIGDDLRMDYTAQGDTVNLGGTHATAGATGSHLGDGDDASPGQGPVCVERIGDATGPRPQPGGNRLRPTRAPGQSQPV
jgi:hypothetical protein